MTYNVFGGTLNLAQLTNVSNSHSNSWSEIVGENISGLEERSYGPYVENGES